MTAGATTGTASKGRLNARRLRVVLFEGRGSRPLADDVRREALAALLGDGHAVTRVTETGSIDSVASSDDDSDYLVLGRFDEAFATHDLNRDSEHVRFKDVDGCAGTEILDIVKNAIVEAKTDMPGGWKPWFPVIDFDRCTNCMQCLTFCLFDVYGVDDADTITVRTEDNCKTDCPACSRVCPEAAIMFPKYKRGPINGAPVRPEDVQSEAMKVDISALLGGDIYSALKTRSRDARERFSTERDESKALLERKRCLKKLTKDLDIPDEVLMTLPSAGDIEERARRAREKAERRQERSRTMQDRRPATEEEWGI